MNPYVIIGALVAALALGGGGYWYGASVGRAKQEVADQAQFDAVNAKLAAQKAEAATQLAAVNARVLATLTERDALKTKLLTEKDTHDQVTAVLRGRYAALRLRVAVPGAAQAGGGGGGGDGAGGAGGDAARSAGAALVQLPDAVAGDLRQLAFDADRLRDDYALCYGYATQVR